MKTAAIENEIAPVRPAADFAELVKARLTLLVLLTTAVGFYLGAPNPINFLLLFHAVFGTALAAAGVIVTFGGGANEVQRDIIAMAGMGLPHYKS